MNFDATIQALTEKRDFYNDAISVLQRLAATGGAVEPIPSVGRRKPHSVESRARQSEAMKQRWAALKENRELVGAR